MDVKSIDMNLTLGEALEGIVQRHPHQEALVFSQDRISFRQLGERVDSLAGNLSQLGLGKGDKVGLILPNCPEFVYATFALAKMGAAAVPMSVQSRAREAEHILGDAEAAAVITAPQVPGNNLLEMMEGIRPDLAKLQHIIVTGGQGREGTIAMDTMLGDARSYPSPASTVGPEDAAMILYTSGTTGVPKGAVHTHKTLMAATVMAYRILLALLKPTLQHRQVIPYVLRRPKKLRWFAEVGLAAGLGIGQLRWLIFAPFYHVAGYFQMLFGILSANKQVVMDRFNPELALSLIERERITVLFGVPTMLSSMLAVKNFAQYDLSSLALCASGAAPVPPQLVRELKKRIGSFVIIGFGTSESMAGITTTPLDAEDVQAETIGRAAPGVEVKIVDEQHREVPRGMLGEIACRAPSIMQEYYKNPEGTAEALDADGWFYTGDLGVMDEQGYVRVAGRKKDMIIRGGANIYPAEIEHYLLTHPKIKEAAVIGVPSLVGGERVWAYVVPQEGVELSATEVLNYCRGQIATYKIPDQVRLVLELPRTAALRKVQKFKLQEEATRELEGARP